MISTCFWQAELGRNDNWRTGFLDGWTPQNSLGPLFPDTQDLNSPKIWMNAEGDVTTNQMIGSHEMDHRPERDGKIRILKKSYHDCFGPERDGRIRILKKTYPAFARTMDGRIRILKKSGPYDRISIAPNSQLLRIA